MGQSLQTQINWFRRQLFWDTLERRILPERQAQNELLALLGKEIPTTRTHLTCRADSVVLHHRAVMGEVIGLGNYSRTLIFLVGMESPGEVEDEDDDGKLEKMWTTRFRR